MIRGKGLWVWQTANTCGGSAEALAHRADELGLGHVPFKVLDGEDRRNADFVFAQRAAPLLRARGIDLIPWGYWYGPESQSHPAEPQEAALALFRAAEDLGARDAIVNAEKEFKRTDGEGWAREFVDEFRGLAAGRVALWLSTFALPRLHGDFPFAGFRYCDGIFPQCYGSRPLEQWREAKRDLGALGFQEVIPTFRAYLGDGIDNENKVINDLRDWSARVTAGDERARCNWWVWQSAQNSAGMMREIGACPGARGEETLSSQSRDQVAGTYQGGSLERGDRLTALRDRLKALEKEAGELAKEAEELAIQN